MKEKISAIIVAAGTGKRMNSSIKKQYMELAGAPILYHTLRAFEKSDVDEIVIVTGEDEIPYVREQIVEGYCIRKIVAICAGGKERCDSVYEGLKQILKKRELEKISDNYDSEVQKIESSSQAEDAEGYVLIHDGVRPLITPELINRCIDEVKRCKACIPGVPEKDTVKEVDEEMQVLRTPDRKKLYRIQTPQCFSLSLIKDAFAKYYREEGKCDSSSNDVMDDSVGITDDAMLVEKYTGHKVNVIEGDYRNIKITTPDDIEVAEYYIGKVHL